MPDLFKEYGIPEFDESFQTPKPEEAPQEPEKTENAEQTEKNEESPKPPRLSRRTRIIIGAAAAAVVVVIAAVVGFSKYQDQKAVDRCREALEEFQSLDSYHVRVESHFEGEGALNDRSAGEYWRSGADLLRCDQNLNSVRKGGATYQCIYDETGAPVWTPAEVKRQWLLPWVAYYDWDGSAAFLSREKVSGGEAVTIQFNGTPDDSNGNIEGYTVCFTLDKSGSLTCAVLTYTEETTGASSTMTFHIGSESPEACAQAIDEAWQEAFWQNSGDWFLATCEAALQNARTLNSCHIVMQKQTDSVFGDLDVTVHEILRCSDTCMYAITTQNGKNTGLLSWDGQWYSMSQGLWGEGNMTGGEDPWEAAWLGSFEWSDDTRFVSCASPDGETNVITVEFEAIPDAGSVLVSTSETVTVTAVFTLDANGNLLQAVQNYTDYGYTVTESLEIFSDSTDEIHAAITEVYSEAAGQIAADAPTLNRVQAALDEFRSLTDFHVVTESTDTVLDTGKTTVRKEEYWRNGANGLKKIFDADSTDPSYIYLYIGNYMYGYDSVTGSWDGSRSDDNIVYAGGSSPDQGYKMSVPFLSSIDLADRVTILRSVEKTEDGTAITVEFLNDFWNYWTMCFYLDPNGSLVSIEENESFNWGLGGVHESKCLYRILPTDSQETAAAIDEVYQEAYPAISDAVILRKCQDALAGFRILNDYAIRWKISDSASGRRDVYEKWHISGVGTYRVQTEGGQTTGVLYWQNQWYTLDDGQWSSSGTVFGDFWTIPWITDYQWNSSKTKLIRCEETGSGDIITFSSDTYTVTFTLDTNGSLTAAEVTYEQDGSTVTCSYEILTTDSDEVWAAIEAAWQEAAENLPADDEEGILPTPAL